MSNRKTVLVVDPRREDLERTVRWLEEAGYLTIAADDPEGAISYLLEFHPDVVVYTVEADAASGWAWAARMRKLSTVPFVIVAAGAHRSSFQAAAELGVDGFLAKPLDRKELLGRLASVTSPDAVGEGPSPLFIFRNQRLTIDWRRYDVWVDGELVHLSPTEFKLLALLVQRRGWVVTYDEILSHIWGDEDTYDRDHVKLYVWSLRRKIEEDPSHPRLILTKRGIGYIFVDDEPAYAVPAAAGGPGRVPAAAR
ncbi:MAG TPA: response regulator transcription factor [Dehalococcoidia bacterium]